MKRFGLPILLSAGYTSLLLFVFSSDFSKEHSFLLQSAKPAPKAKAFEQPKETRNEAMNHRIALLSADPRQDVQRQATRQASEQQSPESAQPVSE